MAVSNSFKYGLVMLVMLTVLPKLYLGGGISNPEYREILEISSPFFVEAGYQVVGEVYFAGKDALLAMKGSCLMYVVPVAHQGWHQATVRQAVGSTQVLWFQFEGEVIRDKQDTFYPLIVYYLNKSARYFGVKTTYPPVLAIVSDGDCSVEQLPWERFPAIDFRSRTLFG